MATTAAEPALPTLEPARAPMSRSRKKVDRRPGAALAVDEPDYVPPDFSASRQIRIGSSFIEQFVAGHDASDVLREVVQNEYDGGGERLKLTFGSRSLEVAGTGRNIDAKGWERLSVIVGTGNVMGSRQGEVVAPKENGIGSKNFGLRSLFRFGDTIHVRSGGQVALLDLHTQETARVRDLAWSGEKGVRVHIPYRQASTERLEAFTLEREQHALDLMAGGLADTLVKLALSGKRRGLREVQIQSIRTGRSLRWKQDATAGRSRVVGVAMVIRSGRLVDGNAKGMPFQEEEFSRSVEIPAGHAGRAFPAYYRLPGGCVKIAVSVPIARKRVDFGQHGHFYYPLKAPSSRTGCAVSVSARFELNTDRSGVNDHVWNDWLIDQAVDLTVALLKDDWFGRYGADAFKALISNGLASPDRFATKLAERLAGDACWPTRARGDERFATASNIVLPSDDALAGFLGDSRYLDPAISGDSPLRLLVASCGAKPFTISSLVRLRCAGKDETGLATKVAGDANFYFTDYPAHITRVDMQVQSATGLSVFWRKLTRPNKSDLANSASTLSATGELRPANQLMIVDRDLWDDCPEPETNRLHPALAPYKAVSGHCRVFNEEQWLIDAAGRASNAAPDDRERETLYRKLLARTAPISRAALTALRNNPVVKNQRGAWVAPIDLVLLKRPLARLLDPVVDAPSRELIAATALLSRLRLRDSLSGADLVRCAEGLADRPEIAERFEALLSDHLKLLTAPVIEALRAIPCLKARSGALAVPAALHLDTPTNRLCIDDANAIVAGANDLLYRKLKLKPAPDVETLLGIVAKHRETGTAPARADLLYPALVEAMRLERRPKSDVADVPICWVQNGYHSPSSILVGTRVVAPLAEAIPIYRALEDVGRAYRDLGAPDQADESHWRRFFAKVGSAWATQAPLDQRRRRLLLEAYQFRGATGLPLGLEETPCLLDDQSRLFTPSKLHAGRLVEPDFPALEDALRNTGSTIGVIERSERSRSFFWGLGIRPLSAIAGASEPALGQTGRPPFWFKAKLGDRVLAMLHRSLFARALFEVASRNRHHHAGFTPSDLATIAQRLHSIREIGFFQTMARRYHVGGVTIPVPAQIAISGDRIALLPPKTKHSFQLLLAEALAEIAGATSVSTMRIIANAFLPLLLCGTQEELVDYLDQLGIPHRRRLDEDDEADLSLDDEDEGEGRSASDDAEELALRQVFDNLDTSGSGNADPVEPVDCVEPETPGDGASPQSSPLPPAPPSFVLPDLDDVSLTVTPAHGTEIAPREPSSRGGGGSSGLWLPPTPAEIERAGLVGQRGEELVYRLELEKARAMGFDEPERYVVWTSQTEPGADHDIRSVDAEGRPRWLEVKSTTGSDGRFDWSRKEFEKALRERERYELWRVYRVSDRSPTAKCFPNPAAMLGTRQIALELAGLRANIEDMG
ncbi:DUF3883 domain-containing protein [Sphingomonas sp. Leaf37]|uniref:DUF3883 domain-containing protein n=1 Tax=Sphingomonas sp. Leaf37 TaxID=2876552 RepID=UPI001E2CFAB4|nr:DUF3883 domain-containing protein [Sphingomonas sp. Leaf37]